MIRRVIHINEDLCTGCGLCVTACHEGAIELIDGKAKLTRDDYCDGLGDCLPSCPTGAITFVEREAAAYDPNAVEAAMRARAKTAPNHAHSGCPGCAAQPLQSTMRRSALAQWPCQIKLAPPQAPYFDGADLLIAADCSAFAYAQFHQDFMMGKITLIGCPKLDNVDYSEKLAQILSFNDIASITVARMEVPCCGGLEYAAQRALHASGKNIPLRVVTVSCDGKIL